MGVTMFYPVYIHEADEGFSGFFPDVPGCIFAGDTVEEALRDAQSALNAHFEAMFDHGKEIPQGLTVKDHLKDEDCVGGFWAAITLDVSRFDRKAKRVQITLPAALLADIDHAVMANGGNRSAFLAEAARAALGN